MSLAQLLQFVAMFGPKFKDVLPLFQQLATAVKARDYPVIFDIMLQLANVLAGMQPTPQPRFSVDPASVTTSDVITAMVSGGCDETTATNLVSDFM